MQTTMTTPKLGSLSTKTLLVVLLAVLVRMPALISPKAIDDERIYSVVGVEMLHGELMYQDAIERKPPLLFWTYKAILGVGGDYNWYFLHFAGLLWVLLTMWGIHKLTERLFGKDASLVAAMFYGIFVGWAFWGNLAMNGELLMNLPIVWGIYFVLRNSRSFRLLELFFSGVLLCCAFLLKQPAAIMAIPLGLYLLSPGYRHKMQATWLVSFLHAAVLTIGFFGCLAAVAAILQAQGILDAAFYWTIGDHDIPHGLFDPVFWTRGIGMTLVFIGACGMLVVGTFAAIKMGNKKDWNLWEGKRPEFWALTNLLIAAIVGLSQPGRFYPHYYIQLVPILCVFAAPVFSAIWTKSKTFHFWLLKENVSKIWLMATIVAFLVIHSIGLINHWENSEVGEYLMANSQPEDEVFVWGQSSNLYIDAQRRASTRYVATFPLTGYIFGSPLSWDTSYDTSNRIVPDAWENLKLDFIEKMPEYIIDNDAARAVPRYPIAQFPYLDAIVSNCYEQQIKTKDGIIYKKKSSDCPQINYPTQ